MFWFLFVTAVIAFVIYKFTREPDDYFIIRNVKFIKPVSMILALPKLIYRKPTLLDIVKYYYTSFPEEKISGFFSIGTPIYIVRDPKLLKKMAVTFFDNFVNHKMIINEDAEPLFAKGLFQRRGESWRDMRATLSPAFTGSKIRQMFEFSSLVGQQFTSALSEQNEDSIDFKELSRKFTVDVIASTAFGIEVNSIKHPGNDFLRIARKLTNFGSFQVFLKHIGYAMIPSVMKMLNVHLFDKETTTFFHAAIIDAMRIREEKGIVRNDMINLLMLARKGKLKHTKEENSDEGFAIAQESDVGKNDVSMNWTDTDLIAQCFNFFFAGFDPVSTAMTFMAYELLVNPDVQKKLYEEIANVKEKLNGKPLTYEDLQGMKYLDQVVSETLRKWPPAPLIDRQCSRDYFCEVDYKKFIIEEGRQFFIPVYGIHHDEKFYANPDKFDPERFNEVNRVNIDPDTYLPFGLGPRNCIGSRLALMEIKTMFYYILLSFELEVTEKTPIPITLKKSPVSLDPLGIFLRLKQRT